MDLFASENRYRIVTRSVMGDPVDLWGLQRINERTMPEANFSSYHLNKTGEGVNVYLIDSGVNKDHVEFGRLGDQGSNVTSLFDAFGGNGSDNLGHGTHMATLIGGRQLGVAPDVKLFSLKIFDRELKVEQENVEKALDAVINHYRSQEVKTPSVLSMSWSVEKSGRIDEKIQELVQAGITCIVAAGNKGRPAAEFSPAHLDLVVTVGAVDKNDSVFKYVDGSSNYGPEVDIFAPGFEVEGGSAKGQRSYLKLNGTSPATAYATGVAACYMQDNPGVDPFKVKSHLVESATQNQIDFTAVDGAVTSNNRLLFNTHQKLNPKWPDAVSSLIGVFFWGDEVSVDLLCESRTSSPLKYELVKGELPKGLTLSEDGRVSGQLGEYVEGTDRTQYSSFVVKATDENASTDRLLYCVVTFKEEMKKEDFEDAYLVELSKAICGGCGCS